MTEYGYVLLHISDSVFDRAPIVGLIGLSEDGFVRVMWQSYVVLPR